MQAFCQKPFGCKQRAASAAFTLAEVMVSVFVLLITVIALFAGFSNGYTIIDSTRQDMRATQILAQKTEAIRLLTWEELSNCPTKFQEAYYPLGSTNAAPIFYGTIDPNGEPTNVSGSPSYYTQVHLVTIKVTWTNYVSGSKPIVHTREMKTLSARYGIQKYIYGYNNP